MCDTIASTARTRRARVFFNWESTDARTKYKSVLMCSSEDHACFRDLAQHVWEVYESKLAQSKVLRQIAETDKPFATKLLSAKTLWDVNCSLPMEDSMDRRTPATEVFYTFLAEEVFVHISADFIKEAISTALFDMLLPDDLAALVAEFPHMREEAHRLAEWTDEEEEPTDESKRE